MDEFNVHRYRHILQQIKKDSWKRFVKRIEAKGITKEELKKQDPRKLLEALKFGRSGDYVAHFIPEGKFLPK